MNIMSGMANVHVESSIFCNRLQEIAVAGLS
jgi:hypothetical protein